MSELDEGESQAVESKETEVEQPEISSEATQEVKTDAAASEESAPSSEAAHEQKSHDGAQKAINKQYRLRKEAEEEAARLRERNKELEDERSKSLNQISDVPDIPEPFEDDYERKIADRDAVILRNAQIKARMELEENQRKTQEQEFLRKQQEEFNQTVEAFAGRGEEVGLSIDQMTMNRETIQGLGIPQESLVFMFGEKDGPQLMDYLAKNPDKALDLAAKPALQQVALLVTDVRSAAASAPSQKVTGAPPVPETLSGGGMPIDEHPALKGATFE